MAIVKENIVKRILADGRSVNGWARYRGHNEQTVHAALSGRLPFHGPSFKAITADLKADGYMTEEDEQ